MRCAPVRRLSVAGSREGRHYLCAPPLCLPSLCAHSRGIVPAILEILGSPLGDTQLTPGRYSAHSPAWCALSPKALPRPLRLSRMVSTLEQVISVSAGPLSRG